MLKRFKRFVDRLRGRSDGTQLTVEFDNTEERLEYARALIEADSHARAAHHYKTVLEAWPDNATVHREYADLLAESGYHESAACHYRRALKIEPDPSVHEKFAALLDKKGETRKAARQQERAQARRAT